MSKKISKYYTPQQASTYEDQRDDPIWHAENDVFKIQLEYMLKNLNKDSISVVDIPCGTGRWIPFIDKNLAEYAGIDISQNMLNEAEKKISSISNQKNRCTLYSYSYQEVLSRLDKKFDLVICTRFLPHFDINEVDQIVQVLRCLSDGYAIIMVRVADNGWSLFLENLKFILYSPIRAAKRWQKSGRISNSKKRISYRKSMKKAGFEIEKEMLVHSYPDSSFEYWLVK